MLINPDHPADRPETAQMIVIHRALRREFGLIPRDPRHLRLLLGMLHEHHEAEDELLWPVLRQRAPLADDLIATMTAQHEAVAEAVERVSREPGAHHLKELHDVLVEHLDLEESAVLPLIHEHLTVAEWHAPQEHAMKHGPAGLIDKLLLVGLVLEDATPRERAWFLSEMPPPARLLWRLIGRRRYASWIKSVRRGPGEL